MNKIYKIIEYWDLRKPFDDENDIPEIPVVNDDIYKEIIIPNIIRCGGIPKSELIIGKKYLGDCRNTNIAEWDGNTFIYERNKFGSKFIDSVSHFEDYTDYDVFIPIKLIN